ncbi:MAG TPA: mannose-6-phosphate isomerase, class I [Propionibacteriaceae bacterium]|nr:mannose-6-phosphate isomerase, class I [Propionibacteriaceae bacterium]
MERLTGVIQPYAWGSRTAIPEFLGVEPTGEPQAELWFGAHPLAPSAVDGEPLDKLVAHDPVRVVGRASVEAFGPRLPFLLKIIAAAQPLSLQAHPSREQAAAGYAREQAAGVPRDAPQRTYRDGWPKPELLCAFVETDALCGFREPAATYQMFEKLAVDRALTLVATLADADVPAAERLRVAFSRLLRLTPDERSVISELAQAAEAIQEPDDVASFARTASELNTYHPGDPGVLAALLMNRITLQPGDALFMPSGNLHAYLSGGGVEIMANSDNVMRGGLTPKYVNVDELLAVLDFTPGLRGLITPLEESPGVWRYPTPAPEFTLWRLEPHAESAAVPAAGSGRILLVTDGELAAMSTTTRLDLGRGEAALLSAGEEAAVTGRGTAFVGGPGVF